MASNSYFFYFAYGSNLLANTIHLKTPSAVRYGIGKLENFRLDFNTFSSRWQGASATIVPTEDCHVWGAIWKIENVHASALDKQEGVLDDIYESLNLNVLLPNGNYCKCKVYQQTKLPVLYPSVEELPEDRQPSGVYLRTIQGGAIESELPSDYIDFLYSIPDNGYYGPVDMTLPLREVDK